MPFILVNGLDHYYESDGAGPPVVLLHGAFADHRVWDPQWDFLRKHYRVLRYDLRGHGKTGPSTLPTYSMDTYVEDLAAVLREFDVQSPILCGQSWGGSIALLFSVKFPERVSLLALAGVSIGIDFTISEKMLSRFLFPDWAMHQAIRWMGTRRLVGMLFGLARFTRGKGWLSSNLAVRKYLEACMLKMESSEYSKIWGAMYGFHTPDLERITCPILVLNGEGESRITLRHTQEILRQIPAATAVTIPGASHAANLDNPETFNRHLQEFFDHPCRDQPSQLAKTARPVA